MPSQSDKDNYCPYCNQLLPPTASSKQLEEQNKALANRRRQLSNPEEYVEPPKPKAKPAPYTIPYRKGWDI